MSEVCKWIARGRLVSGVKYLEGHCFSVILCCQILEAIGSTYIKSPQIVPANSGAIIVRGR